jgi:hypothetical protein
VAVTRASASADLLGSGAGTEMLYMSTGARSWA